MKVRQTVFFLLTALPLAVAACRTTDGRQNPLVIVENGKSDYRIVLPDVETSPADLTPRNLMECAKLLQECIRESTGAELEIVREGKNGSVKPGIYLGNTVFARSNGVKLSSMKQWQYLRKTVGADLILAGLDERGPAGKERTCYSIGTMKAVTAFLQEQLGSFSEML